MRANEQRRFGRAGFPVTLAGVGGSQVANLSSAISNEQADALIDDAWAHGVRAFDTAPLYGHGLGEHRYGHNLSRRPRDEYVLSTKVGRRLYPASAGSFTSGSWVDPAPFRWETDYSYDGVMRQVEDSLQRLCTDRVDILLVHDIDVRNHGVEGQRERFREVVEGAYPALVVLRETGIARAIGLGVNEAEVCVEALDEIDLDCFLLAGRYTLLEQDPLDDLLPMCEERGVALILGGVFNSGILAKGPLDGSRYDYRTAPARIVQRVSAITEVCVVHGVPLAAAALQFAAAPRAVANLCLGARSVEQQQENYRNLAWEIPPQFWADLRAAGLVRDDAPTPDQRA